MKNKENAGKGTFILRCDFYPQVQLLSREQRGDLLTALFAYTSGEDMPSLDGITSMCFEFIRASIDSYSERYDAKCQQNRENGKRGGRPKKADAETVNQSETYKPIVNEDNRMESEKTERFNGNTNETENVGEKENRLGTEKTKRFEKYPNETEIHTKAKDTINNINFAGVDIDVFLRPYVIPIPKASILTDKARRIIVNSIISPLYIICKH